MTDYGNPDAGDDVPDGTGLAPAEFVTPARQAIEAALADASAAKGSHARTLEAKAAHIHDHLTTHGWAVMDVSEGDVVHVGPDQQVVNVPDGFVVDVHPLATAGPDLGPLADPELATLADIVAQLEGLDPEARERVAAFVTHRYGPAAPVSSPWAALAGWDPSRADRVRARAEFRAGGIVTNVTAPGVNT